MPSRPGRLELLRPDAGVDAHARAARRPRGAGRRRSGRRGPRARVTPPGSWTATTPRPTSSRISGAERVRDVVGAGRRHQPGDEAGPRTRGARRSRGRSASRRITPPSGSARPSSIPAACQRAAAHEQRVVVVRPQGDQPAGRRRARGRRPWASAPSGPRPSRRPGSSASPDPRRVARAPPGRARRASAIERRASRSTRRRASAASARCRCASVSPGIGDLVRRRGPGGGCRAAGPARRSRP